MGEKRVDVEEMRSTLVEYLVYYTVTEAVRDERDSTASLHLDISANMWVISH